MAPIHVSGTEGGEVELKCSYPDEHKYTPKYFCRDPCGWGDVLIMLKGSDYFPKGRYSIYDGRNTQTFSLTIKKLQLQDAGVYYCGLDQWGDDTLTKVVLTVRKAPPPGPPPSTSNPPTHLQEYPPAPPPGPPPSTSNPPTHLQDYTTSSTPTQPSTGLRSSSVPENRVSDAPPQAGEDAVRVCDERTEMVVVYSDVQFRPKLQENPSDLYSSVRPKPPQNMFSLNDPAQTASDVDSTDVYSLLNPH